MAAFAEVTDVAAGWRTLTAAEQVDAQSKLDSVAAIIRGEFQARLGLDDVPDNQLASAKEVSIEIVKTAISTGIYPGHTQYGRTEGHRVKSGTLAAPGGTLALTDAHRRQLGLPVQPSPKYNFPRGDWAGLGTDCYGLPYRSF